VSLLHETGASRKRRRLPNRRFSETFNFEVGGLRFTLTYSSFDDGPVGEVFLNNHKLGNAVDTSARDSAIVLSFALQYGAPIDKIRKALCRDGAKRALGPLGAALDLLADRLRDDRHGGEP